jgi:uncharacterized protein YqeY
MSLEIKINEDIKKAMIAKDSAKLNALRAVKSAILLAKTEKGGGENLTEETEIQLLQKLVKQRKDSYEIYMQQQREDLAAEEKIQMDAISTYLPAQMNDEELENIIREIIQEVGASGPQDMGKVMGVATKKLSGKAEGKRISDTVKRLLNS